MNVEIFNALADLAAKIVYVWVANARQLYSEQFIRDNNLAIMLNQPQYIKETFAKHYDCLNKFVGVKINPALEPFRYSDLAYELYKMVLYIVFRIDRIVIDDPKTYRMVIDDKKSVGNSYNGIMKNTPEHVIPAHIEIKNMVMSNGKITIADDPFDNQE